MSNLKDDLIAARALIDTPEKFIGVGPSGACWKVAKQSAVRHQNMAIALGVGGRRRKALSLWFATLPEHYADSMELFDRAIANA